MNDDFFKDIVLDKLSHVENSMDEIEKNINDLCVRMSVLENSYKNHISEQLESTDRKFKLTTVVFGFISVFTTIFNFFNK